MASSLSSVSVAVSESNVTVMWSISTSGDDVTGYLVHYHHPIHSTTIRSIASNLDVFNENSTHRVYAISVQALSTHLPSEVVGPVTVRGQLECYQW